MIRYSRIEDKFPREFVLLQGQGCRWKHCSFCDYYSDTSDNPYEVNRVVLEQVTGEFGVLDVINSGSAMELDSQSIALMKKIVQQKRIHTLWFEAHYMYRNQLERFAAQFEGVKVKFRCGIESFSAELRRVWNKGVGAEVSAQDVAKYFDGVCLLCCTEADSKERILSDIATAKQLFEYCSVNVFCNNTTSVRRDEELVEWFAREVYPVIKGDSKIEVLLENSDLGVG
jgi:uncharacterized Fe-S cluster-containing MiaB family protein